MTLLAVALVCLATVGVGLMGGRFSRATSDFYVASRSVGASRNASAICGEYLSAASFLGVGGLVFAGGLDMLWFPVGYTVGFLALLVLVAAPLRRSGAYTLPDFAAARLGSRRVRRVCGGLVVLVGWLYLLPLLRGAGTALEHLVGSPPWVGSTLVAGVVAVTVAAGGMRSITLVQAGQYWFKLVALAVPALVLVALWAHRGAPAIDPPPGWSQPFHGLGVTGHPFYATVSTILGLSLGTMALPHVVIRLYTNADGAAARRTTVLVVALLGLFYLFPPVVGVLGHVFLPPGYAGDVDAVLLDLPRAALGGPAGEALAALVGAGAVAAFLSTASGLAIAVAGVLDQDVISPVRRPRSGVVGEGGSVGGFRLGTVLALLVPLLLSLVVPPLGLATTVGLTFSVAAAAFTPLLVLSVWWRGLSTVGATAGMLVGGATSFGCVGLSLVRGDAPGASWATALVAHPAAWSIPLAFATATVVSLATPSSIPRGTDRFLARLHTPESAQGVAPRG